jgi:two-component system, cell cycle sensor histidine kinase and response regulator CckA
MNFPNDNDNEKAHLFSREDLETSEIRYRRLFESARDGILILDAVTRKITDANPFMEEFLGYTHAEFLGKELWEIGLLADKQQSVEAFKDLQECNYIRYDDMPLKTKSGESRDVEFVSNVYQENKNQVIQCNIRDITDRKESEGMMSKLNTRFASQEVRLENIVASIPGIVWEAWGEPDSGSQRIDFVSDYVKTLLGYTVEEWLLTPNFWLTIIYPDDKEKAAETAKEHFVRGGTGVNEFRWIAKDGKVIWVESVSVVIEDEKGEPIGSRGVTVDITMRKQAEESLRESERQLRQSQKLESVGLLAGGIAHDFNNMLTAINGYSDLALRGLKEGDPLRNNLKEIRRAGERSASLTHQLLAFSRKQVLKPVVMDINVLITDTAKMLQRLIGEDIQLITDLDTKIGRVILDPGQFSQILMNLIVNARDAMPTGGKLSIETKNVFLEPAFTREHVEFLPGAYVMLEIRDNGTGMSDDTRQHIFEPFFTTKEIGKGTGLGLATVYGIVKQSEGNIEVYSEEGRGTTFKLYFPRVTEEVEKANNPNTLFDMPSGSEKILLVEDEELVRHLSRQILEECGYIVTEATNGVEALAICDSDCELDLLMTDVVMPKMGGRELATKLALMKPDLKVLFTSGYTDDEIMRHGVIKINTNFIQKPFTPGELANKVREVLDNSTH